MRLRAQSNIEMIMERQGKEGHQQWQLLRISLRNQPIIIYIIIIYLLPFLLFCNQTKENLTLFNLHNFA